MRSYTSRRGFKAGVIKLLTRLLVKEHRGYLERFPTDMALLRRTIRPGDVLLVEGSQRISEVIKYLTQSSWSHAALFVGDALVKGNSPQAERLRSEFGGEADALLVESTIESGVAAVPLSKYSNHNMRICRPLNLKPGDLGSVLETVITQIGNRYNIDQIIDLLRYFFPVSLIPQRWRRGALARSPLTQELICSSQIALAFQKVRYPIQPALKSLPAATESDSPGAPRRLPRWLGGRRPENHVFNTHVFTPCDPMLITPRDFDLSPYFEVVKFNVAGRKEFDYKKLRWAQARTEGAGGETDAASPSLAALTEESR